MATEINHTDVLGRPLKLGDVVAAANSSTSIVVGRNAAVGKKQVRVIELGKQEVKYDWRNKKIPAGILRYPNHTVLLEDTPELIVYLLKLGYSAK
jgi:hypothetical protein